MIHLVNYKFPSIPAWFRSTFGCETRLLAFTEQILDYRKNGKRNDVVEMEIQKHSITLNIKDLS